MNRRSFLEMVAVLTGSNFADLRKTPLKEFVKPIEPKTFRQRHRFKIDGVDFSDYLADINIKNETEILEDFVDGREQVRYIPGLRDVTIQIKLRGTPLKLNQPLFSKFNNRDIAQLDFAIVGTNFKQSVQAYITAFVFNYDDLPETVLELRRVG